MLAQHRQRGVQVVDQRVEQSTGIAAIPLTERFELAQRIEKKCGLHLRLQSGELHSEYIAASVGTLEFGARELDLPPLEAPQPRVDKDGQPAEQQPVRKQEHVNGQTIPQGIPADKAGDWNERRNDVHHGRRGPGGYKRGECIPQPDPRLTVIAMLRYAYGIQE